MDAKAKQAELDQWWNQCKAQEQTANVDWDDGGVAIAAAHDGVVRPTTLDGCIGDLIHFLQWLIVAHPVCLTESRSRCLTQSLKQCTVNCGVHPSLRTLHEAASSSRFEEAEGGSLVRLDSTAPTSFVECMVLLRNQCTGNCFSQLAHGDTAFCCSSCHQCQCCNCCHLPSLLVPSFLQLLPFLIENCKLFVSEAVTEKASDVLAFLSGQLQGNFPGGHTHKHHSRASMVSLVFAVLAIGNSSATCRQLTSNSRATHQFCPCIGVCTLFLTVASVPHRHFMGISWASHGFFPTHRLTLPMSCR